MGFAGALVAGPSTVALAALRCARFGGRSGPPAHACLPPTCRSSPLLASAALHGAADQTRPCLCCRARRSALLPCALPHCLPPLPATPMHVLRCRGGSGGHAGGRRAVRLAAPLHLANMRPSLPLSCRWTWIPCLLRWPAALPAPPYAGCPSWCGGTGLQRPWAPTAAASHPRTAALAARPHTICRRIEVLGEIPELSYPRNRSQRFDGSK